METAVRAPDADVHPALPADDPRPPRRRPGSSVLYAAAALVVLQLVLRGWVAARGNFFEDDLILVGRAASFPLWSSDYLLYDHAGHLMPGSFLMIDLIETLAPLNWTGQAVSLMLLQALASLAVLRLLRVLLGDRPLLLLPLALYLFSPLSLSGFAWWAAAVNHLPLHAGLAWVAGDAVKLVRTGRSRYAVTGTLAFAAALSCFAKAVVIPWFALALVVLLARAAGDATPIRSCLRRGAGLWTGTLGVTAAWAWAYSALVGSPVVERGVEPLEALVSVARGIGEGVVPALVGGPWRWAREGLSAPWAVAPVELSVAAGLVAVVAVVVSIRRRRDAWLVWLLVGVPVTYSAALMVLGRYTENMLDVLPLTLRHFSDLSVVLAVAVALILAAPRRDRPVRPLLTPRGRQLLVPSAVTLFVVSSIWSTASFVRVWSDTPAQDYLATARMSLAESSFVPLLDQQIPDEVLWGASHPENLASQVFAPLEDRPSFATWTWDLRTIDETGRVVPAGIEESAALVAGPEPDCGHRVGDGEVAVVDLDRAVFEWDWTVRLDYIASREGQLQVSLSTGEGVRAVVRRGLNSVYLRLVGSGDDLRLHAATDDLDVCVTAGAVGLVVPAYDGN